MCAEGKCLHPLDIIILIIGYIQAIVSALGVLLGLSYVVALKDAGIDLVNSRGKMDLNLENDNNETLQYVFIASFSALTVIITVMLIGSLSVASVLIHGVQKRKEQHVMVYLISAIIVNVMYTSGVVMSQSLIGEYTFQPYTPSITMAGMSLIVYDTYRRIKVARTQGYSHNKFINESDLGM